MAQQPTPDLSAILAALGHRPANGTPTQGTPSQAPQTAGYPGVVSAATPANPLAGLALPQPTKSGNLDLSSIKPVNSGSVSLADAIAKARGIAAEKASSRDDPRQREYRRSRSRSPPRYRDNYNPFRDERRDGRATGGRDRSVSPPPAQTFSPSRSSQTRTRSPPAKAESNSEIITVQSSSVGLIIGRGGENLRRVESETGARVQFITGPEGSGPLRQCRISGTPRQRADAKKDIFKTVEEHPSAAPEKQQAAQPQPTYYGYGSNGSSGGGGGGLDEVEQSSQIMVPDRTVGLIIGRGGETIRDIQERSGCHVNITSENKSINGYRPVNLMGTRATTDKAKQLIQEVVDSDTRAGPPVQMPAPVYSPHPPVAHYGQPQYGMPYDAYASAPPPHAGGYAPPPVDSGRATDTIVVPSEAVGMIIGKGGETIKEMQNVSGCKINVAPPTGPDINREIGLIGSRQAIEAAKRAIWDKVNAVREKQGGVWTRGGEVSQPPPQYADPYASTPAPYGQPAGPPSSVPPPDQSDPYAPYGGYHAYMAMWAAYGNQPAPGH